MTGQEKEGEGLRVKQEVDEAVEEDASVDGGHVPRVLVEERLGPQRGRDKGHDQVLKRPACRALVFSFDLQHGQLACELQTCLRTASLARTLNGRDCKDMEICAQG